MINFLTIPFLKVILWWNAATGALVLRVLRAAGFGIEDHTPVLVVRELVVQVSIARKKVDELPARGIPLEEGVGTVHGHR